MKSKPSKSLVFSFFLIGIILGIVLLDAGVIHLPAVNLSQTDEPAKIDRIENSQPAVPPQPKKEKSRVSRARPAKDIPAKPPAAELPQTVAEPIICDQNDARAVRKKAQELSVITEQGGVLVVTLGKDWAYYTPGIKRSFIERFTASDTCLQGGPRSIVFYFRGKQVAIADIHGAIELK